MLYQIPGTSVRVLGSMHLVPPEAEAVPDWALQAYEWAEDLVLEHNARDLFPYFRAGRPLRERLAPDLYGTLESFWPTQGPLSPLIDLHPWVALIGLGAIGLQCQAGIEPNFIERARGDGKRVDFLETPAQVARHLGSAPDADFESAIQAAVDALPVVNERFRALHAVWLTRNREGFWNVMRADRSLTIPSIHAALLGLRNAAWADTLQPVLASPRRTLVVVGALHLCGPASLESQLGIRFASIT